MLQRSPSARLFLGIAMCVVFVLAGMGINRLSASVYPRFGQAVVKMDGQETRMSGIPVSIHNAPSKTARLRVEMELPHPESVQSFLVLYSHSLDALTLNGQPVDPSPRIHVDGLLQSHTVIEASLSNTAAYTVHFFGMAPSIWNRSLLPQLALTLFLACVTAFAFSRLLTGRMRREILLLLLIGALLRGLYMSSTMPIVRTYDTTGHLDYVRSIAEHFALPPQSSWESQQPPLYHALVAPVVIMGKRLHVPPADIWLDVQFASLLLSILTLIVGMRMLTRLLSSRLSLFIACAVIAVFPGLIYFSSQINNDVLLTLLGFLWFEALLHAWKSGRNRDWMIAASWVAAGMLTKGNAALWGIATVACILLQRSSFTVRARQATSASLIMLTGCLFFFWRLLERGMVDPISNAVRLHPIFHVETTLANLLTLHPISMLLHPFASGAYPESRPEYFLEAFIKTSQFGSSWFGPAAAVILLLFLFALVVAARGFLQEICKRESLPIIMTTVVLCGGLFLLRVLYPYASSSHFRYVPVLVLPLAYFLARGAGSIRCFPARSLAEVTVLAYAVGALGLILAITLAS